MIVLDAMLGKLSRYLRMLGYDIIIIDSSVQDEEIIKKHHDDLILTRDKDLARKIKNSIYVVNDNPAAQLKEVIDKLPSPENEKFSICTECGSKLAKVTDISNLPPFVPREAGDIYFCERCEKYYWNGSHIRNFKKSLEKMGIEI